MKKKILSVLTFLILFMSGFLYSDAGNGNMREYECCNTWISMDKEDTWITEEYQEYCVEIGGKYNICPELLIAMIERESNGKARASNSAGDTGLLQVNPRWHYSRMERLGIVDLYDPYSNITVAADYLAELFKQNDDLYLVLMKYNMDPKTAEELCRQGNYSEYAMEVSERAWELEKIHERKGKGYGSEDCN